MLSIPLRQYTPGRRHGEPDCVVIHWSAGSGNVEALGHYFQNTPHREASYHRAIGRDGEVASYVATTDTAWHAGDGEAWDGGRRLNERSVGVCLCLMGYVSAQWAANHAGRTMIADHRKPGVKAKIWERPTPAMVATLRAQLAELKAAHPSIRYVLGHDDVTKGKIDPGPILDGVDLGLTELGLTRIVRRWDLPGAPWEGFDSPALERPEPIEPILRAPVGPIDADAGPTCPEVPPPPPPPPVCEAPLCKPMALTAGDALEAGFSMPEVSEVVTSEPADPPPTPAAKPARRRR